VEADYPVAELASARPSEIDKKIASIIIEQLEDGCCLQLGIGGMPNVVGEMIANSGLKDIGIHMEMFVDSMVDMVEKGRITGARKNIDKYKLPGRTNQKRAKTGYLSPFAPQHQAGATHLAPFFAHPQSGRAPGTVTHRFV